MSAARLEAAEKKRKRRAEKMAMGTHLDIDDVAAGHPLAMAELDELRAEIQRLRRYADAINGKPGTERHVYAGLCPDSGQPDSRDPKCPACRLLVSNA